jgi:outer membrane protein assembly factor BamB
VLFILKTNGPVRGRRSLPVEWFFSEALMKNFYAVDARTGLERWHVKTGGAVNSSPAVAAGVVYFHEP